MAKQKKNKTDIDGFALTSQDISRLSGGKRERAMRLYEKASFMDAQLMQLQSVLAEKGWTEQYQNGSNQFGLKKSSEAEVYISLSKNYMAIMKQLEELVASVSNEPEIDPLAALRDE